MLVHPASATQIVADPGTNKGKGPCPTDAYTSSTLHHCPPPHKNSANQGQGQAPNNSQSQGQTGTAGNAHPTVSAKYQSGAIKWQSCGWPGGSIGSSVQIYVAGVRTTGPGSTGIVQPGGCTPDPVLPICLSTASYPVVALDPPFGQATSSMTVTRAGCSNPVVLSAASAASGGGGTLAFTGSNVLLLIAAAAVVMVIGYAIVRLNRQRRRAT
jgi:hypothetical protein